MIEVSVIEQEVVEVNVLSCLLLPLWSAYDSKSITAHVAEQPLRIDGIIEEVWQHADSAYYFVQHIPCEESKPYEKTVAYVLKDRENPYFVFWRYVRNRKPAVSAVGDDYVIVKIAPFGSKTARY